MATSMGTVTVEVSNYFQSTRMIRCVSTDCAFFQMLDNDYLGCGLKEITIGKDGRCERFEFKEGDESKVD